MMNTSISNFDANGQDDFAGFLRLATSLKGSTEGNTTDFPLNGKVRAKFNQDSSNASSLSFKFSGDSVPNGEDQEEEEEPHDEGNPDRGAMYIVPEHREHIDIQSSSGSTPESTSKSLTEGTCHCPRCELERKIAKK